MSNDNPTWESKLPLVAPPFAVFRRVGIKNVSTATSSDVHLYASDGWIIRFVLDGRWNEGPDERQDVSLLSTISANRTKLP